VVAWGKSKENGIWWSRPKYNGLRRKSKLLWRGHDSLFVRVGRLHFRLMKPWRA
jgi:hypothetical protein